MHAIFRALIPIALLSSLAPATAQDAASADTASADTDRAAPARQVVGGFDYPPAGNVIIREHTRPSEADFEAFMRERAGYLPWDLGWQWRYGAGSYFTNRRILPLDDQHEAVFISPEEREALVDAWNQHDMAKRAKRATSRSGQALQSGLDQLSAGEYRRAVIALTLSAKLNHGDPASRLHLAQARLALGHYVEAAHVMRRALQLQPLLVYMDLQLDEQYPNPDVYSQAVAQLTRHVFDRRGKASAEEAFLLGFLEFQRGEFDASHRALRLAARGLKECDLTRELLSVTKPAGITTESKPVRAASRD